MRVALLLFAVWTGARGQLAPSAFPELPQNLRRELERRGCMIPQVAEHPRPHNVIRGQFARPGQTDWAVLCSVGPVSTILVFWSGSERNPAALAAIPDADRLYSREIRAVGRQFILQHFQAHGGPKPPPIDHQAIDDAFVGKASVVFYWHRGKWLELTGAD